MSTRACDPLPVQLAVLCAFGAHVCVPVLTHSVSSTRLSTLHHLTNQRPAGAPGSASVFFLTAPSNMSTFSQSFQKEELTEATMIINDNQSFSFVSSIWRRNPRAGFSEGGGGLVDVGCWMWGWVGGWSRGGGSPSNKVVIVAAGCHNDSR